MKLLKLIIGLFGIISLFTCGLQLIYSLVHASQCGWVIIHDYNSIGEGWAELIMICILVPVGIVTVCYLLYKDIKRK